MWLIKGKINNSTETVLEKRLMANILNKNIKVTVLKMLKKPKEDMEKVKKIMLEQNGNISKEIENLKIIWKLNIQKLQ